jgi:hypothetical protein
MKTNNKPENIKEFKALIERYESISLEEIEKNWTGFGDSTAKLLTGFSSITTCTLCIPTYKNSNLYDCHKCVYRINSGCLNLTSLLTLSYKKIYNSRTPLELLNAYRERAIVLREFAKENKINIK